MSFKTRIAVWSFAGALVVGVPTHAALARQTQETAPAAVAPTSKADEKQTKESIKADKSREKSDKEARKQQKEQDKQAKNQAKASKEEQKANKAAAATSPQQ